MASKQDCERFSCGMKNCGSVPLVRPGHDESAKERVGADSRFQSD